MLVDAAEVVLRESISDFVKKNWSYYAESISYFVKSVVLRRIDLVLRQIDVLPRIDLVLVISITECCSQRNESFYGMRRTHHTLSMTLYACTPDELACKPRV